MKRAFPIVIVIVLLGVFLFVRRNQELARRKAEEERRRKEAEALALKALRAKQGKITVIVARRDLPPNQRLVDPARDYEEKTMLREFVPEHAATSVRDVKNWYTLEDIPKGDIINKMRLTQERRSLTEFLGAGERFYSIRIDGRNAAAGFVKQGDHVDILGILRDDAGQTCRVLLHNVTVFSVDGYQWVVNPGEKRRGKLANLLLTLKLSQIEASELVQAIAMGTQLLIALRHPADLTQWPGEGTTFDDVLYGKAIGPGLLPGAQEESLLKGIMGMSSQIPAEAAREVIRDAASRSLSRVTPEFFVKMTQVAAMKEDLSSAAREEIREVAAKLARLAEDYPGPLDTREIKAITGQGVRSGEEGGPLEPVEIKVFRGSQMVVESVKPSNDLGAE